jgi:arylsulfatase A-like enzyme
MKLRVLTVVLGITATAPIAAFAQARPANIVVIVADDMGYADVGFHGGKEIPTPNLDALAATGVRFTDAYVSGPYCSPTRAGLLTGKYPQRFGHEFNIGMIEAHRDVGLPLEEVTLADRLKAAGYRTALIGKWHLGMASRFFPTRRGFDEFFGFLPGAHSYTAPQPNVNPIYDGEERVPRIPYLTDTLADRAAEFIARNASRPFFLYLAFNAVHTPLQAPEKYLARFPNITNLSRRRYAAMLSAMDDGIGKTIAALRSANLEDNTLVVFFSDNGGPIVEESWNGSNNAPLRGSKAQTWEGGIRVPFIMRWKGRLPAGKTYSQPVIQLDVHTTALAAAGIPIHKDWQLDGVDLLPFVSGRSSAAPHDALFWRLGGIMAVRKGPWKLVQSYPGGGRDDPSALTLSGAQLFNLRDDIGETSDVAAKHPQRVKELSDTWRSWANRLTAPKWSPPQRARAEVRRCESGEKPAGLTGYVGTWQGGSPGAVSFSWTQRADSGGTFKFARDSSVVPTRTQFASPDSAVIDVTQLVNTPASGTADTKVRIVAHVCGSEMTGRLLLSRPNDIPQSVTFDAARSP